jgi:6-phosphogluconolactonase
LGDWEIVVDDIAALQQILSNEILARSADAIARRSRFVLAVPGGSVASTFFPALARLAIDWAHVDVFWIDERAVRPDHPDSNYALASKLLLQPARVPSTCVHRMPGELDLEDAARRASDELMMVAGNPPQLDLALIGVGEDGHVASIFSRSAGLTRGAQPVIAVHDAPKPPPERLTMTLSVLGDAGRIIVAGFGPSKSQVIHEAVHGGGAQMPVAKLLSRAASSIVLLDSPYSH